MTITLGPRSLTAIAFAGALAFGAGYAVAAQPYMQAALGDLEAAKAALQKAEADKGGHRVAALKLINNAIAEVHAGMSFAASH